MVLLDNIIYNKLSVQGVTNLVYQYRLFYGNKKGNIQHLTEDFKQLVYDSEAEARAKLDAIEAERFSEDSEKAFSVEEAKGFAETQMEICYDLCKDRAT